jgi:hypothetical protein
VSTLKGVGEAAAATAGDAAGEAAGEAAGLTAGDAAATGEAATDGEGAATGDTAGLAAAAAVVGFAAGGAVVGAAGAVVGVGGACEQPAIAVATTTTTRFVKRLSKCAKSFASFVWSGELGLAPPPGFRAGMHPVRKAVAENPSWMDPILTSLC